MSRLFAQSPLLNLDDKGIVIDGYDPVAYFKDHKPVKGDSRFKSTYAGSGYYFSSEENKKLFDSDPGKYQVQFGGFCAYAVSQGHVSPIDPEFCVVQKDEHGIDRLICQHNQKAADLWNKNSDGLLVDADRYWRIRRAMYFVQAQMEFGLFRQPVNTSVGSGRRNTLRIWRGERMDVLYI